MITHCLKLSSKTLKLLVVKFLKILTVNCLNGIMSVRPFIELPSKYYIACQKDNPPPPPGIFVTISILASLT